MPRHMSTDSSLRLRNKSRDKSRNKSRNATPLTSAIEKKLLGYATLAAASGVAMLALTPSAEAKVVYTPTNQKLPLNTTFALDVNGDGIPDFNFFAGTFMGGAVRRDTYTFNSDGTLGVSGEVQSNQVWGLNGFVSALPAGVKVGPNGKFAASHVFLGLVAATDGEPPSYFGPWAPKDGNVKNHYVGLKFVIDGENSLRLGQIQRADSPALERQGASHTHGICLRDGCECPHPGRRDIRHRTVRDAAGYVRATSCRSGRALILSLRPQ
jgi:hypothetical protein